MLKGLTEADARVDDDVFLLYSRLQSTLCSASEEIPNLSHHVFIARALLHAFRFAPHMHKDDGTSPLGHYARHPRVSERGDVVNNVCSGIEGSFGGRGPVGVDRDNRLGANRQEPS
jgi:hypothetical protein